MKEHMLYALITFGVVEKSKWTSIEEGKTYDHVDVISLAQAEAMGLTISLNGMGLEDALKAKAEAEDAVEVARIRADLEKRDESILSKRKRLAEENK